MRKAVWKEFKAKPLLPANEAYRDETRIALDKAVLGDLLGLNWKRTKGPLDALRHQWCSEPTVHGGQATQPGGNAKDA